MDKEEIARKISEFADYLNVANIFTDVFRWLIWVLVQCVGVIVDGLEKVTDEVLLIKTFFQNPEIVAFVDTIRPFLYILLAFSLLYAGYLLIFQKKFDREGMAMNVFIAMIVILLLGTGMEKANEFTDEAINAVKTGGLYESEEGTLSDMVIQQNVTDLVMFDQNGWSTTDLSSPNSFTPSKAKKLDIKQRFTKSDLEDIDIKISPESEDISKYYLVLGEGDSEKIAKFDQSGLEWNNEYYYRYDVDWITLIVTLAVMGFTLFSVAYKLARLSFELTFNYVLAILIAPADIHDGQKTKKVIQSILNTFLVMILIFLSIKVYMMGTAYIANELDGLAYLITLIAFSVAVIDGPNIVERLFGIDAGLKSGWGVLAGAYAGGKMVTGLGKGLANMAKEKDGSDEVNSQKSNASKQSKLGNAKAPSPNEEREGNKSTQKTTDIAEIQGNKALSNKSKGSDITGFSETSTDTTGEKKSAGTRGISAELEQQETQNRTQTKAPSPNDTNLGSLSPINGSVPSSGGSHSVQKAQGVQKSSIQTDTDITSIADRVQGNSSVSNINTGGSPSNITESPTSVHNGSDGIVTQNGSQSVQRAQGVQKTSVQTDISVTSVADRVQGSTSISSVQSGAPIATTTSPTNVRNSNSNTLTTSDSHSVQKVQGVQKSSVQTDVEVSNVVEQVQSNTTTSTTNTVSSSSQIVTPTNANVGSSEVRNVGGSHSVDKTKVVQNSTVQLDMEVASTTEQVQGRTTTTNTNTVRSDGSNSIQSHSYERKRPRSYNLDNSSLNTMKNFKNKK